MRKLALLVCLLMMLFTAGSHSLFHPRPQHLNLTTLANRSALPFIAMEQEQLLESDFASIKVFPFPSPYLCNEFYLSGNADLIVCSLLDAILLQEKEDLTILALLGGDQTGVGSLSLVGSPAPEMHKSGSFSLATPADLTFQFVCDHILTEAPIPYDEVEFITENNLQRCFHRLLEGDVSAALLPEPMASFAVSLGCPILGTQDTEECDITVLCMRQGTLGAPDLFLQAYHEAIELIHQNPDAYYPLLLDFATLPTTAVHSLRTTLLSMAQAPRKFVGPHLVGTFDKPMPLPPTKKRQTQQWLQKRELVQAHS